MFRRQLFSKARLCMALLVAAAVVLSVRPSSADGPAPRRRAARFEIKLMKGMIDHHMMAVMMAELCRDRTLREELVALCDNIMETQTAEIQQMQSWLEDWYGISYEPRMPRKMESQLTELAELSGAEFELEFLMMMIEHHADAIEEGRRPRRATEP